MENNGIQMYKIVFLRGNFRVDSAFVGIPQHGSQGMDDPGVQEAIRLPFIAIIEGKIIFQDPADMTSELFPYPRKIVFPPDRFVDDQVDVRRMVISYQQLEAPGSPIVIDVMGDEQGF
jgi:hypothetical protein